MTSILSSPQNPRVKAWLELKQARRRRASGQFLVEGARLVAEALLTGAPVEAVIYCQESLRTERARRVVAEAPPALVWQVTETVLGRLTERDDPAEVFAVCRNIDRPLEQMPTEGAPLLVALDEPRGPGNLGTLVRIAEGVGADGLILIEPAVDLYHPLVVRSTVGSLFGFPIARAKSRAAFLDWFQSAWASRPEALAVAAEPEAEMDYASLDGADRPMLVFFGNEERGLADELRQVCQAAVGIRMFGRADSLNTASAAAVILCDLIRKRGHGRLPTPQHTRIPPGYEQPRRAE